MRTTISISTIMTTIFLLVVSAGVDVAAGPRQVGGKSGAWQETYQGSGVYVHQNKDAHWKALPGSPGGKLFTQPGKAEGKASDKSVITPDFHQGTQLKPGSKNRK